MPTYTFKCSKCEHKFDVFQGMDMSPPDRCPECNAGRPERIMKAGGSPILKGSGFYATDYKNKDKPPKECTSGG